MARRLSQKPSAYAADAQRIERMARNIVWHAEAYIRNGFGDEGRFHVIDVYARMLLRDANRAARRYEERDHA